MKIDQQPIPPHTGPLFDAQIHSPEPVNSCTLVRPEGASRENSALCSDAPALGWQEIATGQRRAAKWAGMGMTENSRGGEVKVQFDRVCTGSS